MENTLLRFQNFLDPYINMAARVEHSLTLDLMGNFFLLFPLKLLQQLEPNFTGEQLKNTKKNKPKG